MSRAKFLRSRKDRIFDDSAGRFRDVIYGSLKGRIRLAVLERDFVDVLGSVLSLPVSVLDAGGGSGQFSARLAAAGHRVTLAEPSVAMIEQAKAEFALHAPDAEIDFVQSTVQALPADLGQFDLVLFHAVLEWLVEPRETLALLLGHLKPGGHLSLLFYNRNGLEFRHLTLGNFGLLKRGHLSGIGEKTFTPISPLKPEQVVNWLEEWGYEVACLSGVRCFHDFMRPDEAARAKEADVLETELIYSRRDPYRQIARYMHLIVRKPA